MRPVLTHMRQRLKDVVARRSFWIVASMLVAVALLHYLIPQLYSLLPWMTAFLSRHAVERIIFILPVGGATFAFGQTGGLVTLGLAVLIMLPRVLWISPQPLDSGLEMAAVAVVGYFVTWMIETQEREKRLRQRAVEELETANAVAATLSQSLDLDEILDKALQKVLEAGQALGFAEPKGGVFVLAPESKELYLRAHRGLPPGGVARQEAESMVREYLPSLVGGRGSVVFSDDYGPGVSHALGARSEPCAVVPLRARDRLMGAMLLYLQKGRKLAHRERQLLTSIGSQIGMAIENVRLYENLRFYVREITRAQESERKRIAQELHDETIQMLVVISRRLEVLTSLSDQLPEPAPQYLQQLRDRVKGTTQGLRRFVQDLRPSLLDHLGLVAALEGLVGDLRERDGIAAQLQVKGEPHRLPPEEELVLFRIAQEALNNVRRHAGASSARLQIEFDPGKARMTISDDGCGFSAPERITDLAAAGQLGLIGMHERARLVGGTLVVRSVPGEGTTVTVTVPSHRPVTASGRPGR